MAEKTTEERLDALIENALKEAEACDKAGNPRGAGHALNVMISAQRAKAKVQPPEPAESRLALSRDATDAAWRGALDLLRSLGEDPEQLIKDASRHATGSFGPKEHMAPPIDVERLCDVLRIDPKRPLTRNEERALGYAAMAMVEQKPK